MRNRTAIRYRRNGFALLVVLLIVATIFILSLGFAGKADRELSFGEKVEVGMQMDYLLQSSLNYAKALLMNPQNVSTGSKGYWEGGSGLQIESGNDYFDVTVARATYGTTNRCTYNITSEAYRQVGGSHITTSEISGVLRFDPCIGYVQLSASEIPSEVKVKGDVWCNLDLRVHGTVNGDVFANGLISEFGTIDGEKKTGVGSCPTVVPNLQIADYERVYYIGSQFYLVEELVDSSYEDLELGPSENNPAGIFYHDGNLDLKGVTEITGMLVVKGDLTINDGAISIGAVKNFPALLVGGDIKAGNSGVVLDVAGLAQVGGDINMSSEDNCVLTFNGALHVLNGGIKGTDGDGTVVTVTADPMVAALKIWSDGGSTVRYWMPAGAAYFKSIACK